MPKMLMVDEVRLKQLQQLLKKTVKVRIGYYKGGEIDQSRAASKAMQDRVIETYALIQDFIDNSDYMMHPDKETEVEANEDD